MCVSPVQVHPWLSRGGAEPLPLEEEHCSVVEVTEEEVKNSVKTIPSLPAVVRVKYPTSSEQGAVLKPSAGGGGSERAHVCSWCEILAF